MAFGRRVSTLRRFGQKEESGMNIYIGNLAWETTDEELKQAFVVFGEVTKAVVIKDRLTGRSRGFGFVEMSDEQSADKAIEAMNGADLKGRNLRVNVAKPRTEGKPRSQA